MNKRRPHFHKPRFEHVEAIGADTRAAAAKIVNAVSDGLSLNTSFAEYCAEFDGRDTAFIKEIVYGTLRHRRILMSNLKPMFDYKITERHRIVQALLICAMYQICFMRVPSRAVVASTVSACALCGRKSFTGLVNAILRRFLREGANLTHSTELAVEYSFSDWMFNHLQKAYPKDLKDILIKSNEKAPLFIRVESSNITRDEYVKLLDKEDISYTICEEVPNGVMLDNALNVADIPGFFDGLCTVQDISAQIAAPLLDLDEAHSGKKLRILDCCCAPGGKTAHILDLAPNAEVVAIDVDEARIENTKSTLTRLKRTAELHVLDAQDLSSIAGTFDRILVDAPCSGSGVIRRHPDIKWLRRASDIEMLSKIQSKILDEAYSKLNSGGILLYTTCSIFPEENINSVKAFLERHPEAKLKPFKIGKIDGITDGVSDDGSMVETLQRLPGDNDGDGFFYARFVKP